MLNMPGVCKRYIAYPAEIIQNRLELVSWVSSTWQVQHRMLLLSACKPGMEAAAELHRLLSDQESKAMAADVHITITKRNCCIIVTHRLLSAQHMVTINVQGVSNLSPCSESGSPVAGLSGRYL